MQLNSIKIKQILRKYKYIFDTLENYDKTHELPFQRKRIDITLSKEIIKRLKKLSKETGKSRSYLIEEKFK